MTKRSENLVWIDMEMTGLDVDRDHVLEIASVVTDKNLNVLAEGPVIAIYQPDSILDSMDDWNINQHTKSGLIERVKKSKITEEEAEALTLEFLKQYVDEKKSPLCGNSIYQDRKFLWKYMPTLERFFHYRNLDVSSIKILAMNWAPKVYDGFKKDSKHLALSDIHDSINELRYYREHLLRV